MESALKNLCCQSGGHTLWETWGDVPIYLRGDGMFEATVPIEDGEESQTESLLSSSLAELKEQVRQVITRREKDAKREPLNLRVLFVVNGRLHSGTATGINQNTGYLRGLGKNRVDTIYPDREDIRELLQRQLDAAHTASMLSQRLEVVQIRARQSYRRLDEEEARDKERRLQRKYLETSKVELGE